MRMMRGAVFAIAGMGLVVGGLASMGEMDMAMEFGLMPRATATVAATGTNVQTFTGALGGATADPILTTGNTVRPFSVDGDTFTDFPSALERSCANQHNACADIANSGKNSGVTTAECETQQTSCLAATEGTGSAASTTTISAQQTLFSQDANFLYICDV